MVRCDDTAQQGGMASPTSENGSGGDSVVTQPLGWLDDVRKSLAASEEQLTTLAALAGVFAAILSVADLLGGD